MAALEGLWVAFDVLLPVFVRLTWLYWVLGSAVYSLKFLSPAFDRFTSYGKLQPRALQGSSFPWAVENRLGFTAFYVFGFAWNLLVIALQVALVLRLSHTRSLLAWAALFRRLCHEFWARQQLTCILQWHYRGWAVMKSVPFSLALQIQVTRRAYECLCVHKFSPNAMNLFQFIAGVSYYGAASFDVMELIAYPELDVFPSLCWSQILAFALFLYCNYVQNVAHRSLASLREGKDGSHDYFLPSGGWFDYISSPHYTAEIIGYFALVWFTSGRVLSVWLSMMFVTLNISHSAFRTHQWYQAKFKDYPRARRAVLPWLL